MNIEYLYSIMNLYFRKENKDCKTSMKIVKKNENIEFNFNMNSGGSNKTCFFFPMDLFDENLDTLLSFYKNSSVIVDEKYQYDRKQDYCKYYAQFKNGRKIQLNGFDISYINKIRNSLYNKVIKINELNLKLNDELNYDNGRLTPAYSGFASFKSILLISVFFLVVLVVSLIYFM